MAHESQRAVVGAQWRNNTSFFFFFNISLLQIHKKKRKNALALMCHFPFNFLIIWAKFLIIKLLNYYLIKEKSTFSIFIKRYRINSNLQHRGRVGSNLWMKYIIVILLRHYLIDWIKQRHQMHATWKVQYV